MQVLHFWIGRSITPSAALLQAINTSGRRTRWTLLAGSLLLGGVLLLTLWDGAVWAPTALLAGALLLGRRTAA